MGMETDGVEMEGEMEMEDINGANVMTWDGPQSYKEFFDHNRTQTCHNQR